MTQKVPTLLDDEGNASVATALMMSHHAFRRDLARFAIALKTVAGAGSEKLDALRGEWRDYHNTLHGHHHHEDTGLFPMLAGRHESLRPLFERLTADHRRIDPLLERGDAAFAQLPDSAEAAARVVSELGSLLDEHLATEEAEVIPHLRAMKAFPAPASDQEMDLYAQGFAWASYGIAPQVLNQMDAILPASVTSRLPAARADFEKRWKRVWGAAEVGASFTPIPSGLGPAFGAR
jgi:hypothetical protein